MSRIIIRNLPDKITKEKLEKIFSEKGQVTDIQLKFTKGGKFRKFAFVGFKSSDQADAAVESLNKTFINSSQIYIEKCAELADPNKPRAWSKHAPDSSAFKKKLDKHNLKEETITTHEEEDVVKKKKHKTAKIKDPKIEELLNKNKGDDLFKEFLEVHMPDDESLLKMTESSDKKKAVVDEKENKVADLDVSDLQYLKSKTAKGLNKDAELIKNENKGKNDLENKRKKKLYTVKLSGLPHKVKKSEIKEFLKPLKAYTIRRDIKVKVLAFCGFLTEKEMKLALNKNRTFLREKRIFVSICEDRENAKEQEKQWKLQEDRLKNEESIAETGRIFVRNLPYTATEEEFSELFTPFGPVTEVILPIDSFTRKSKGFGIVTFMMPEHASKAYTSLDGTIFQGRMLHLLPSRPKDTPEDDEQTDGKFKKKKSDKQKTTAGSGTNWNTFFIGENALAEAMASTYNTSKETVLTDQQSAVRLALGETQIVTKMKEFLEDNQICLDAFNNMSICPRSKSIILVKNLPFGTKVEEIREKFSPFGELKRIVLPPNGVTAVVEFIEPFEAGKAFKRLAYSKFKYVPLFLEWAPEQIFSGPPKKEMKGENDVKETKTEETTPEEEENVHEPVEGATLFVKNLNFTTDSERLRRHFSKCGKIISANVATKMDPAKSAKPLSLGYGFVQFASKEVADAALKTLQLSKLDEHSIELKRSNRTTAAAPQTARKTTDTLGKPSTKIVVRNVPFQATKKEIYELFKVFGEVKAARLPKKMVGSGSHRGFCFVEFHTVHEAKRAFKALSQSTHLYGRRLVLEWAASNDDDVETLRQKTAQQFESGKGNKKKNITIEDDEEGEDS